MSRVVITGAAGALGKSVVSRFLAGGARILAVDANEGGLAELAQLAPSETLAVRRVDLANSEAVVRLFDEVEGVSGIPSAIVHLVGGFRWARFADLSDRDWSYLITLNLETTFRVFREAARRFERAKAGSLVAVSAPAAYEGAVGVGAYAGCKAAMLRMVESLARELAPSGGRANAVLPGSMDTPANRASMPDADPATWARTEDVAEAIWFLTTPEARAINGAAVRVPGPTLP